MAISKACGGMTEGSFHDVVSWAFSSFLRKYGDLAARRNLCRFNDLAGVINVISEVWG